MDIYVDFLTNIKGHGNHDSLGFPLQIQGLEHITVVAAGGSHSVAINEQGHIFTFGGGTYGQLGHGRPIISNIE